MSGLHFHTMEVAERLLTGESFGGASLRRAVSSAYYAVFQRLSALCAARVAGRDERTEDYLRLFRALDHKPVRVALNKSRFRTELGVRFEQLQDVRHWADYSIASHPDPDAATRGLSFSVGEALGYIEKAREALHFIESLDEASQLNLVILLIVRDR